MRTLQIAVIGSGSSYTPELIQGFMDHSDRLKIGRLLFCDIDGERNEILAGLARRMLASAGLDTEIVTAQDMRQAVTGADYVIAQVRVGGMEARIRDEKIPLRHGLLGQETTGIGGMVCAFRTIPVLRELAGCIRELAPEAWLINFSNPSGLVAEALSGEPGLKIIGLCNIPISMTLTAQTLLGAQDDFDYDYIGLNHLAWLTGAYSGGREVLRDLLAMPLEKSGMANIPDMPYTPELLSAVGGFPCSYLSYYYFRNEMLKKCVDAKLTRGEECLELERGLLELYGDETLCKAPPQLAQRGGANYSKAAVSLLDAIENDRGTVHVVNVQNRGSVPFLETEDVAEIRCRVGREGPVPLPLRRDPGSHIKGLMQTVKAYEKLAARAALTGCLSDAVAALLTNPLTQDHHGAKPALEEMLAANREFLPQFTSYFEGGNKMKMNDPRYFLGLDGGGTKTHCVLYDAANDSLDFATGGPSNHEVLPEGMESLPEAILDVVSPLLSRAGIGIADIAGAAFGMGGIDVPIEYDLIHDIVSEMGFGSFGLCNDGYLGIRAECDGTGICAVNGSGYSVVGLRRDGSTFQIGGHSDMSGDVGGGSYLVPAAVRAAYTAQFKKGPPTLMTDLICGWLDVSDRLDFCQAAAISIMNERADAYHRISQILYRAAGLGDAVALKILTECGEDYALSVRCIAEELELERPVDVVLIGSQFTKCECDHAIKTMERVLNPPGSVPGFRLKVIGTAPVAGALLWALEIGGHPVAPALKESLKTRITSF